MVSLEGQAAGKRIKQGRWTEEEQRVFASAVQIYGKRWKKLEQVMGTRTSTQCRSHGQKYFLKLKREQSKSQSAAESANSDDFQLEDDPESEVPAEETGEEQADLEEMDNNQLRGHLEKLIQVNMRLTKEIQRLRLRHSEPGGAQLAKRTCTAAFPAKTTEVKVIFSASESFP